MLKMLKFARLLPLLSIYCSLFPRLYRSFRTECPCFSPSGISGRARAFFSSAAGSRARGKRFSRLEENGFL